MKAILDTGPWVALIDKTESSHETCVNWFENYVGQLYSTEAVLTEVLYLLNFSIKAQSAAMDFVIQSVVELIPSEPKTLENTKNLMQKYSDLPMDYADATIVCLAMETGVQNVVTLDRKDSSIYRVHNANFAIFP